MPGHGRRHEESAGVNDSSHMTSTPRTMRAAGVDADTRAANYYGVRSEAPVGPREGLSPLLQSR